MAAVRQIHGGWGSLTFLVDGEHDHILRFARTAEVAAAHRREAALLPLLARSVSFAVPVPDFFRDWGGRTCMGYPLIVGRPLTVDDDWRALAGVLRELHGFPVEQALGSEWRAYYERLWTDVTNEVVPVLDTGLRASLVRAYQRFLDGAWDFTPVLVHRDLAPEHVLVDDGRIVGLIDFEDATIGDPAIDFAGLLPILGWARIETLIADYGRPISRDRLRCYWWLVPVHELRHGLATGDQAIIDTAVAELRKRV
ncbi:MAG TPA: phosphotransferase [Pseudonocardiaceae bacterium]|nr:phosphotransferase [Pseudonocardiaceae bacterium]